MKKSLFPLIVIALAVAVLSTGAFYWLVSGKMGGAAEASSQRAVVVAARPVAAGTTLAESDLRMAVRSGAEQREGLPQLGDAVGKTVTESIPAGALVTRASVAAGGQGGAAVPQGMRAISVLVGDSAGVLTMVRPGQRIDLQAVHARTAQEVDLRTVAEDIEVLKITPPSEAGPGRPALPGLTLLVTPGEANAIAVADSAARLRVALRNPLDRERTGLPPVSLQSVLRGSAKPAAAALK